MIPLALTVANVLLLRAGAGSENESSASLHSLQDATLRIGSQLPPISSSTMLAIANDMQRKLDRRKNHPINAKTHTSSARGAAEVISGLARFRVITP